LTRNSYHRDTLLLMTRDKEGLFTLARSDIEKLRFPYDKGCQERAAMDSTELLADRARVLAESNDADDLNDVELGMMILGLRYLDELEAKGLWGNN
jgi:hypothetical protein